MWLGDVDTKLQPIPEIIANGFITGCRSHMCHWLGLGQVGHSFQGEPVGVLGPWTGVQCGQTPCPPATNYLTNPQPDRLIFCHMGWLAGHLQQASWLTAYCPKCQPDPPPRQETSCGQLCDYFSHIRPVVRCTPLVETSHCQVWYYFRQDDLWSDVPRQRHLVIYIVTTLVRLTSGHMYPHPKTRLLGQVDIWSGFWSCRPLVKCTFPKTSGVQVWYHIRTLQWKTSFCLYVLWQLNWCHIWAHIILCIKPKTEKVIWIWKDDWPPRWLLHHKRPFSWEENYLASFYFLEFLLSTKWSVLSRQVCFYMIFLASFAI